MDIFDVRSIVTGVALFVCLGCTPLDELSSYSEGAAPGRGATLDAPSVNPDLPSEESPVAAPAADDAASAAPMVTAAVDETAPEGVSLDPTSMNAGASTPAEAVPGDAPDDDAPGNDAPDGDAPVEPPAGVDAADTCQELGGFTIAETESCYMVGDNVFGWQDARSFCQAWGGDLVEIGSLEEHTALARRIEESVWIGANDREQEGAFRWASGAPLDYEQWAPNQPNDFNGSEDCTELIPMGGGWIDVPCAGDVPRRALCELSGAAAVEGAN